jgi:hypothetical protein
MNCTEDQFRGILAEEAADITAESVPLLRLPDRELTGPSRGRAGVGGPRWRWLVPLGAAAAVATIAVAATALSGGGRAPRPGVAAPSLWHGVPSYYLAETGGGTQSPAAELVVRDTRSEATLASARPSGCNLGELSAAADDRTFAIACQLRHAGRPTDTDRLLLARFNPVTRRLSVTAMRLPLISFFSNIALSPGGTRIAVMSYTIPGARDPSARGTATLRVYSVATGAVRTWTAANVLMGGSVGVSWGPGSLLAFDYETTATNYVDSPELPGSGIRLLNVDAPPGSLVGASTLAVPTTHLPGGYLRLATGQLAVSRNGSTVATVLALQRRNQTATEFAEFSLSTGKLLRRWLPSPFDTEAVIWSNVTGKTLVAEAGGRAPVDSRLGILTGDRFTPLPGAGVVGFTAF